MDLTSTHTVKLLELFINDNPSAAELKRALAVKLSWEGYAYREIQRILGVSLGFITKWNHYFEQEGIDGLQSTIAEGKGISPRSSGMTS
jgi:transposase